MPVCCHLLLQYYMCGKYWLPGFLLNESLQVSSYHVSTFSTLDTVQVPKLIAKATFCHHLSTETAFNKITNNFLLFADSGLITVLIFFSSCCLLVIPLWPRTVCDPCLLFLPLHLCQPQCPPRIFSSLFTSSCYVKSWSVFASTHMPMKTNSTSAHNLQPPSQPSFPPSVSHELPPQNKNLE